MPIKNNKTKKKVNQDLELDMIFLKKDHNVSTDDMMWLTSWSVATMLKKLLNLQLNLYNLKKYAHFLKK